MKRLFGALAIVWISLAIDARAQQMAPRDLWPQASAAARDGDFERAEKHTAELLGLGKTYGIRTFPVYASAAAALAGETGTSTPELTKWAAATAGALDPRSPAVAFSDADRAMSRNDWSSAVASAVTGFVRAAGNYRTNLLARADLLISAALAVVLTAVVLALALFLRYGRSAAHDFRELLSARLTGGSVSVLAFALLFLPVFLWLGPVWLVFYWFAIFFGYAGIGERIAIAIVLAFVAVVPMVLSSTADTVAGVDSPIVQAAISGATESYQPDAVSRLREVIGFAGNEAMLHVLMGNLESFEGREDQAAFHYRRAAELRPNYAGAHVNLGNLLFQNNEFPGAITAYEKAQQADPDLAIAFYNHSVAAGETYKFDQQAEMLELARKANRSLIERLSRNPPPPTKKVVTYYPPIQEAWEVSRKVTRNPAARALFGNYSDFDAARATLNPLTIGALLALVAGPAFWWLRRRRGFANACIKCGRTFCHRCKSARESATYCTQCIHIYLKRDGVSLDTKRRKLDEVNDYLLAMVRRNRILATLLPGSAQVVEGNPVSGVIGFFLFALFVVIAVLVGRLAPALGPAASMAQLLVRAAAVFCAVATWAVLAIPVYRRKAVL